MSSPAKQYYILLVCSTLLGVGLLLIFGTPHLFKYIVQTKLVLTPSSWIYEKWVQPPFQVPMDFYFFNWTNPEDVYNETAKPKFEQLGPYRFWQTLKKSHVVWNQNGTVSYKQKRFWFYDDSGGNGNLQDQVTTINPVALATVHVSRNWNYLVRKALSATLSKLAPTINITRTVSQMLFEGYPDTLITIAQTLPFFVKEKLPPWNKFGWFYQRNGSADFEGAYTVGSGTNSNFGQLYEWNHWTQTPYYKKPCGKIFGSTGDFFGPASMTQDWLSLFSSDLCQTIKLDYSGPVEVNNIRGIKYVAHDYMLDNGTLFPDNKCVCNGECLPSGVLNVSSCRFGSPAFASLPHFYNADPYYSKLVEGLRPESHKHELFVVVEPTTGIPLEVRVRLQINLMLHSVPEISMYEKAPKIFFPMLWFDQTFKIPERETSKLKFFLDIPEFSFSVGVGLVFINVLIIFYISYKQFRTNKKRKEFHKEMKNQEEELPLKAT